MRKSLGAVVISAALLVSSTATAAETNGDRRLMIVDTFAEGFSFGSQVWAFPDDEVTKAISGSGGSDISKRQTCDSLDEGPCAVPTGLSLRLFLPRCDNSITSNCIEGLQVSAGADRPLVDATFIGGTDGRTYAPDAKRGFPGGTTASRWRAPNALHAGKSDTYAVKLLMDAHMLSTSKQVYVFGFSAIVEPYTESTGTTQSRDSSCSSWQLGTTCGVRTDFADGQRVALSVRLPNTVTGWLNGRLKGSNIVVEKFDSEQNRLRVEADPVMVPEVNALLTASEFNSMQNPGMFTVNGIPWVSTNAGNPAALEWIRQLAPVLKDRSTGEHTTWAFSTVSNRGNNNCLADKTRLIGLVTTNAAVYEPGAPSFDGSVLNYRVGGLHYRPDGTSLTQGTYDLLLRSDVARCLYNFSQAPLSATVSVNYDGGGDKQVATTTLSEKDGWLHLGAYGFTFSTPTLKVTLKGQTLNAAKSLKQTTTVCVKGKSTKKVSGSKCPSGWRKR